MRQGLKLNELRVGGMYLGADGEIRQVLKMQQRYGGVKSLEWVSTNRTRGGKPGKGEMSPEMFARWAQKVMAEARQPAAGD